MVYQLKKKRIIIGLNGGYIQVFYLEGDYEIQQFILMYLRYLFDYLSL